MTMSLDRRLFMKLGAGLAALGGTGVATGFGMQMAAVGAAASATSTDYKAIVCLFMFGGADANNSVVATDTDSWGRYFSARNQGQDPIALMPVGTPAVAVGQVSLVTGRTAGIMTPEAWGGVLPIVPNTPNPIPAGTNATTRTFGLHPFMGPVKTLFDAGRLAVVANVGTLIQPTTKTQYSARSVALPANLGSHNDQQSIWQSGAAEGARVGWGGRMGDMIASLNGTNSIFTSINATGQAVFLSGQSVIQYPLSSGTAPAVVVNAGNGANLFSTTAGPAAIRDIIRDTSSPNDFNSDYSTIMSRSMSAASAVNTAFANAAVTAIPSPTAFVNPFTGANETNSLAVQLRTVARMIATRPQFGLKRQVFFVSIGGFDSHDTQNRDHSLGMARIAHAMAYFDQVLGNIGGEDMRPNVTTFTGSDFSRTFHTNGDGTDHAWGGHHFVMGGAVNGKNMYGQFPTIGLDVNGGFNNPDLSNGNFVPTTSVDQYAATIGAWFGVSSTDLNTIFPNLRNFSTTNLGFV